MSPSDLFFVRYAPGAAGNFLISLLQTSNKLAHWDKEVEKSKSSENFKETFLNKFYTNFGTDLNNHLMFEPHHCYDLDFISAKHPRGDDLTFEQFIDCLEERKDQLLQHLIQKKQPVLRLNKPNIPLFAQGSSVVNIIVDQISVKWFNRIRFVKLFDYKNGQGISKENHPEYLRAKFKKILFNNQYQFDESKFGFIKHKVINDPFTQKFFNENDLLQHPSNNTCNQYSINLSNILNPEKTQKTVLEIFEFFDLGIPDLELVDICAKHFYNNNVLPFEKIL